ncbi:MAG: hypothetical protein QOG53_2702 [Frankiales bacterium]|jgi:HAD superfamily hydrolase (TIGR01509 family)|nr:hypothetical protein [Frankiales bacterium]
MATPTIAAVLFDLDGLLVDSEPVWYAVECEVVERFGGVWSKEHQAAITGGLIDNGSEYIIKLTGAAVSIAEMSTDLLGRMVAAFAPGVPLMPGAHELIQVLTESGIPIGVVSSSYRVLVDAALAQFPNGTFAVTVSGDEVTNGKPDAEPYAVACAHLGVDPDRCVVLEDSPMGVASAEAAGCRVIAVPDHAVIEETPRRRVVGSLEEVDLAMMRDLVAANS